MGVQHNRKVTRDEVGVGHDRAARAATREQRKIDAEAAAKGITVEEVMRLHNCYPGTDPLHHKLDNMEYDYLRAARRATKLQQELEHSAYICGMTVEQYMQAKGILPCSAGA